MLPWWQIFHHHHARLLSIQGKHVYPTPPKACNFLLSMSTLNVQQNECGAWRVVILLSTVQARLACFGDTECWVFLAAGIENRQSFQKLPNPHVMEQNPSRLLHEATVRLEVLFHQVGHLEIAGVAYADIQDPIRDSHVQLCARV